ncbi:DUF6193 family natural product biosynthesis protein [Streptomyces sp. NPDC057011]
MAAARRRGPAETVEAAWQALPLVWQWTLERHSLRNPGAAFPGILPLLSAAGAEPRLRQLYPFTSHWALLFSCCTSYPWDIQVPFVEPLHNGRFRVRSRRPRGTVIGETETADEAVALVMAHFPPEVGPAVAGSAGAAEG